MELQISYGSFWAILDPLLFHMIVFERFQPTPSLPYDVFNQPFPPNIPQIEQKELETMNFQPQ